MCFFRLLLGQFLESGHNGERRINRHVGQFDIFGYVDGGRGPDCFACKLRQPLLLRLKHFNGHFQDFFEC
jgi:hypothetical protein